MAVKLRQHSDQSLLWSLFLGALLDCPFVLSGFLSTHDQSRPDTPPRHCTEHQSPGPQPWSSQPSGVGVRGRETLVASWWEEVVAKWLLGNFCFRSGQVSYFLISAVQLGLGSASPKQR